MVTCIMGAGARGLLGLRAHRTAAIVAAVVASISATPLFAGAPKPKPIDEQSWFTSDDYPVEAEKKGIEGAVTFELDVDSEGKSTACRIAKSSGSDLLDQATCRVVLARARFSPAIRHGKAVPSRFSQRTVWRVAQGLELTSNGYSATILDFSKDPAHPTCSVVSNGLPEVLTCEQALTQLGSAGADGKLTKLVALASMTSGNQQPFRGEPDWGRRLSFVAIDLYPKAGTKGACVVVAREGAAANADPCAGYADAGPLSEEDRRNASKAKVEKAHIEHSLFGVMIPSMTREKCKDGESVAEVHSCA